MCRERASRDYFALKILAIHDVIRLKQVEHVKNEKNILKVCTTTLYIGPTHATHWWVGVIFTQIINIISLRLLHIEGVKMC